MLNRGVSDAISEAEAIRWLCDGAFSRGRAGRIGVELEWILHDPRRPGSRSAVAEVMARLAPGGLDLPAGGRVSFEPGGQVELSTRPAAGVGECLRAAAADLLVLREFVAGTGLVMVGQGLDPRPPKRLVENARYAALESHYDQFGDMGRLWMCNTASIQVNIDAGDDSDGWSGWRRRWWLANSLGPVLLAMFANSPGTRSQSERQVVRFHTDPTRSDPMALHGDPRLVWANYVLDAYVVGIPAPEPQSWQRPVPPMTMREWLRHDMPRPAGRDDLSTHLMTIAPPVIPRGYLELRMMDAQTSDNWVVPIVVVGALIDDPIGSERAAQIAAMLKLPEFRGDWLSAAYLGMNSDTLAAAANACFEVVVDTLPRLAVPPWAQQVVSAFIRAGAPHPRPAIPSQDQGGERSCSPHPS